MHWVALHSTKKVSDKFGDKEIDDKVCFSLTLMFALRRRKPWLSCFLQSAINALIAIVRR